MITKLFGDRVLIEEIKEIEEEVITESGIVLMNTAKSISHKKGIVKLLGNGENIKKYNIEEGREVLFHGHTGQEIRIDGLEYFLVDYTAIMAEV